MADTSVIANPGAGGSAFAVDDASGVEWPYTKMAWGPSGTQNAVDDVGGKRVPVIAYIGGTWTVGVSGSVAVLGPLTDTQLRASPVPVSGTVTANQGGAPWSQDLTQVGGTAITLGQKAMAASLPVVLASDQTALLAQQSGTWTVQQGGAPWSENITQIGAAALSLGAKASSSSIPVVLATDEAALPVSQSGTWTVGLAAGSAVIGHVIVDSGAIAANAGTNLNTSLLLLDSTFTGRINTQGQKTMAASTPVVLAGDQTVIPVSQSGAWTVGVSGNVEITNDIGNPIPVSGIVTEAATATALRPGYPEGVASALSQDLNGGLRVSAAQFDQLLELMSLQLATLRAIQLQAAVAYGDTVDAADFLLSSTTLN